MLFSWLSSRFGLRKMSRGQRRSLKRTSPPLRLEYLEDRLTPSSDVLVFTTPAMQLSLGQPSQPMTVQLQDGHGNAINATSNETIQLSSSSSTGQFLDTSGQALTNATITIQQGTSSASFEYKDSQAGFPILQANATALNTTASQQDDVGVSLYLLPPSRATAPGHATEPIVVQLMNSNTFQPFTVASPMTIQLSSSSSTGQFLDTSGNALLTSSITIAAGSFSAQFEYQDSNLGLPTLTVSADGAMTSAEIDIGLSVAFTTSPQTLTVGQPSQLVTLQLQDSNGQAVSVPAGGTIQLFAPGNAKFFDVNGKALAIGQFGSSVLTVPANSSTASFTFQTTLAGQIGIDAFLVVGSPTEQKATVLAGPPTGLKFETNAPSLLQSVASGSIIVDLIDQYRNPALAPSGGVTVNLSSDSSGGQFLSAGGSPLTSPLVTIAAGSSSAIFEYQDSQAGTATLTGAANGFTSVTQRAAIAALSGQIHVSNTNDSGSGSLRDAIAEANSNPGSIIVFDAGVTGAIDLVSALPALTANAAIVGPGANRLTIERSASATTNFDIFTMGVAPTGANPQPTEPAIVVSGLTVANAKGTGVINWGFLTLQGMVVKDNQAPQNLDDSFPYGPPGGIGNVGVLKVLNSTIADNSTTNNRVAAGIDSEGGFVTVLNSTITGNVDKNSNSAGGIGIYGGSAYIASSTISGNTATQAAQIFGGSGGGIDASGTVTLYNTIVAGNTGSPGNPTDVSGDFISLGHNLIGTANTQSSGFVGSDLVGTTTNPVDAKLGTLGNNGGPTPTMALLTGSPAIGVGSNANAPATDQRGNARPQTDGIDIGAYQVLSQNVYTHDSGGRLTGISYTNGNVYERVYASDGTSTATLKDRNDVRLNDYSYNAQGQLSAYNTYYANGNVFHREYGLDGTSTATLKDSSGQLLYDYSYNAQGAVTASNVYYSNGNVFHRVYVSDGSSSATLKDGGGKLLYGYSYNAQGGLTAYDTYYANGNVFHREYGLDGTSSATLKDSGGQLLYDYGYNAQGAVTDSNVYYSNGNVFHRVYASDGSSSATLTNSSGATVQTYTYNTQGQLISFNYANGKKLDYTYNNGVLSSAALTNGGTTIQTYNYNAQGQMTNGVYAHNGNVLIYNYTNGVLTTATLKDSSGMLLQTYTYNAQSQVTSVVYATNGNTLTFNYTNGVLSTATLKDSSGTLLQTYNYNAQGQLATIDAGGGNLLYTYTYDSLGRVSILTYASNGNILTYTYNGDGTSSATLKDSSGNPIATYGYDVFGRVTRIDYATGNTYTRTYAVDGSSTATLTDSKGKVLQTYTYDPQGNLIG